MKLVLLLVAMFSLAYGKSVGYVGTLLGHDYTLFCESAYMALGIKGNELNKEVW